MGQTIHQESTGEMGGVAALARRVHHILSHNGDENMLICNYSIQNEWHSVTAPMMVSQVRQAAKELKMENLGIDADLIGAHSLRAGGAMALKLMKYSDTTIQKIGRWTSSTWLQYIHNQIAHLSKGVAADMSKKLPFLNIGFIEPPPPQAAAAL